MSLILAIDVGNTATTTGLYHLRGPQKNPRPIAVWNVATSVLNTAGPFRKFLRARVGAARIKKVSGVIVSSVVPPIDRNLTRDVVALTGAAPVFVTYKTPSPVRVRYARPSEVGADRVVNARAAWQLHHGASIVIDFGTATTFDCVTRRAEYLGGVIAPGPAISAEALYRRTAKLPMVFLDEPADILGKNTLESIRAGLYHGYRGLVIEIVRRLKLRLGGRAKVFATGGQAAWILRGVPGIDRHVPHLTLAGLYHLWTDGQPR